MSTDRHQPTISELVAYSTGSYVDPAWLTSLAGSKITGDIAGNAAGFTGTLNGDVSGTQGATQIDKLQGKPLSASAPNAGQVLTYDGSRWSPATLPTPAPSCDPLQVALLKWYTNTVTSFPVGSDPLGVAVDGNHIWVANGASNTVTELNASDGSTVRTVSVGRYPVAVAFDGSHIWVANGSDTTVSELNPSDGSTAGTFNVGSQPSGVAFDGSHI